MSRDLNLGSLSKKIIGSHAPIERHDFKMPTVLTNANMHGTYRTPVWSNTNRPNANDFLDVESKGTPT